MRLATLGLAPLLLAYAVLSAQQTSAPSTPNTVASPNAAEPSAASAGSSAPATAPASRPSGLDDPIARGQAKAAERAQKDQAKADAKAKKEAEKQKKEQEEDAKLLKLEDNEIAISVFDQQGNPVKIPHCAKKDKSCQEKRKALLKQKRVTLNVENGTLTVDGMIAKARLNYEIPSFLYLYISVPEYGTIVASPVHFPYSTELKDALSGTTLTITTPDDRVIQLAGDKPLSGKTKRSIFYVIDRGYRQPGGYPTIGYGTVNKAPYAWPGTLPLTADQKRRLAGIPDLPKDLEIQSASVPCQTVAPGEPLKTVKVNGVAVLPQPCKATQVASAPGAFSTAERPPDGSGAASTGVSDTHPR